MELREKILDALPTARKAHFAKFIEDYEYIRAQEGRGTSDERFYLALPHRDLSGRNGRQWAIRAKSFNYLIAHVLSRLSAGANVLDLGAGNCWMSFQLQRRGFRPVAVDLLTNEFDGLGAAVHFHRHLPAEIPRFRAELSCLPFQNAWFHAAIFNASLHYAEDFETVLSEALRCVRPGGIVVICDTPWYSTEESGHMMVAERQASFRAHYQRTSASIQSLEFLTNNRLHAIEKSLGIRWTVHRPWYGLQWALRPMKAKLRGGREPSRFRIYVATREQHAD